MQVVRVVGNAIVDGVVVLRIDFQPELLGNKEDKLITYFGGGVEHVDFMVYMIGVSSVYGVDIV